MSQSPTSMPSLSGTAKRWLVIALVALAAVASAGITWKVGHDYDERREADRTRSLGLGVRPALMWTLDAKRLTGNAEDVVLQMPSSLDQTYGYIGTVDSTTHLIAAVGRPARGDISTGVPVGDVTLVGVDRADGSPDWTRAIGRVNQCSYRPADAVACWSQKRVVVVDTSSGRVRSDTATDFDLDRVDIVDGRIYLAGQERGSARRLVVTSGTVDAPSSSFRRTIEPTGTDPHLGQVSPSSNTVTVSETVAGPIQYRTTVFDLDSGARRFAFDGDLQVVGNGLFRSDSYVTRTKSVLGHDGELLEQLASPSQVATPATPSTAPPFVPMLLGAGAYDPDSGRLLWRDPVLEYGTGPASTARAVVGNVVVVASPSDRTIVGLDARSGRRVWQTQWRDAYWIFDGITDGRYFVFSDFTGMHSIDAGNGKIMWTVRASRGVDPRYANVASSGRDILRSTRNSISVWGARTASASSPSPR